MATHAPLLRCRTAAMREPRWRDSPLRRKSWSNLSNYLGRKPAKLFRGAPLWLFSCSAGSKSKKGYETSSPICGSRTGVAFLGCGGTAVAAFFCLLFFSFLFFSPYAVDDGQTMLERNRNILFSQ